MSTRSAIFSFNAGELSPQIDTRSDTNKYGAGCRIMENMVPRVYGAAVRRPGTLFIHAAKTGGDARRLAKFVYSDAISYVVEMGNEYFRFYYDDAILTDSLSVIVETATPYAAADLTAIHIKQVGDVMRLVHKDYPPYKLSRTTATSFSMAPVNAQYGPFLTRNDIAEDNGVTLTYAGATEIGAVGTLTSSTSTFVAGHVGSLWKLICGRDTSSVNVTKTNAGTAYSSEIAGRGVFRFATHGTWTGTVRVQRSVGATGVWDTYREYYSGQARNVQESFTETDLNVKFRISVTWASGTIVAELTPEDSLQESIFKVVAVNDSYVAQVAVVVAPPSVKGLDATYRWAEGAWSDYRGYPCSLTFFQNRCIYLGMSKGLVTIWCSRSGDFDNFAEGLLDADAFSLTLPSTNTARWIEGLESLSVGTSGDEWKIQSTDAGKPLTPTSFDMAQQTTYGSSSIQPEKVNDVIMFANRVNRKVFEITYTYEREKYVGSDMTVLAEHITEGGLVCMAYSNNPDPILWSVRADGQWLAMTYERQQDVVAWSRMITEGSVKWLTVTPESLEDAVWLLVTRTIDSVDVTCIEKMMPFNYGDREDAFFVDSGVKYTSVAAMPVTGLDHLESEEVAIYGDGAVYANQTVTNGSITLTNTTFDTLIVGLPYKYRLQPMRLDVSGGMGTSQGMTKKITTVIVNFFKTLGTAYGTIRDGVTDMLYNIEWRTTEAYDSPPALFTGQKELFVDGGFDTEDPIVLEGESPEPCVIRSIIVESDITG